jgi:hypothetical protein
VQSTIPRFALRACLRCDFSVRLEAIGCLRAHFPALAAPWSRGPFSRRFAERVLNSLPKVIQDGSVRRHGRGPRAAGRECVRAALRFRSQSKIAAQGRRKASRGSAGAHPSPEHAVWQSEVNRKGVAGACGAAHTTRHVFMLFFLPSFLFLLFKT